MVLNIFPRRKEPAEQAPATEFEQPLPEPSAEALADTRKRPARRGSRGGRGRGRGQAGETGVAEGAEAVAVEAPEAPVSRRAPRRRPAAPAVTTGEVVATAEAETAPATVAEPAQARPKRPPRQRGAAVEAEVAPDGSTAGILRAIEQQNRKIDQLIKLQEEMSHRGGGGAVAASPPARVGIFVDAANVELAADRLRSRFDWAKVLKLLTKDRLLVRAIAYSPVHDDPGVSIETQRFVEPFLDKGYKVVTKPLKRFQDGTIKANVDIELALDIVTMLDRLDVVCLVSGDGDFQRLVELVQSKGVRVEVVAVGSSTAANLRHAADEYIDLQGRLRDIRV
jgi:uncharacterized LabA/DUF88 family protein